MFKALRAFQIVEFWSASIHNAVFTITVHYDWIGLGDRKLSGRVLYKTVFEKKWEMLRQWDSMSVISVTCCSLFSSI